MHPLVHVSNGHSYLDEAGGGSSQTLQNLCCSTLSAIWSPKGCKTMALWALSGFAGQSGINDDSNKGNKSSDMLVCVILNECITTMTMVRIVGLLAVITSTMVMVFTRLVLTLFVAVQGLVRELAFCPPACRVAG